MASLNTGGDRPLAGVPTVVRWHWFYHMPSLPLWLFVGALLVAVRGNRDWQAWLIFVPLVAVAIMWRLAARLFFLPPEVAEGLGGCAMTLAIAWAIVWLVGHRLASQHGLIEFFGAAFVMMSVGFAAFVCFRGTQLNAEFGILGTFFAICVFTLLASIALAAYCCRFIYHPGRFLAWLLLWVMVTPVVTGLVVGIAAISITAAFSNNLGDFLAQVVMTSVALVMAGGIVGGIMFLFNLPFMVLFVNSPLYRVRFRDALRLPESMSEEEIPLPTLPTVAAPLDHRYGGSNPFLPPSSESEVSSRAVAHTPSVTASDGS